MVSPETHDDTPMLNKGITLERNKTFYGWKIKIEDHDIDKLEKLNSEMLKRFAE